MKDICGRKRQEGVTAVIESEAKQSSGARTRLDASSLRLLAMTGRGVTPAEAGQLPRLPRGASVMRLSSPCPRPSPFNASQRAAPTMDSTAREIFAARSRYPQSGTRQMPAKARYLADQFQPAAVRKAISDHALQGTAGRRTVPGVRWRRRRRGEEPIRLDHMTGRGAGRRMVGRRPFNPGGRRLFHDGAPGQQGGGWRSPRLSASATREFQHPRTDLFFTATRDGGKAPRRGGVAGVDRAEFALNSDAGGGPSPGRTARSARDPEAEDLPSFSSR